MTTVLDNEGHPYFLELKPCPPYFLAHLSTEDHVRVATAKFKPSKADAELIDIVVGDHVAIGLGWRWKILRKPTLVNYRGRGLGTGLLKTTFPALAKQGVKTVWGIAEHKDLQAFYERLGFTFEESTKKITLHL